MYYVVKTLLVLNEMFDLVDKLQFSIDEMITEYAPRNDLAREQLQSDFKCSIFVDGLSYSPKSFTVIILFSYY